jgi:hypothetical protein
MSSLCNFLTHYFEADKGPFLNICDLSDEQIESIIAAEKDAETPFNRFALGLDFFKLRRAADDFLIQKYRFRGINLWTGFPLSLPAVESVVPDQYSSEPSPSSR